MTLLDWVAGKFGYVPREDLKPTGDQDLDFVLGVPGKDLPKGGYQTGPEADAADLGDLIRRGYGAVRAVFGRQVTYEADLTGKLNGHVADVRSMLTELETNVLGEQGRMRADIDAGQRRADETYTAFEGRINARLEETARVLGDQLESGLQVARNEAKADDVALEGRVAADRKAGEKSLREDYDAKLTAQRQAFEKELEARDEALGRQTKEFADYRVQADTIMEALRRELAELSGSHNRTWKIAKSRVGGSS